MSPHLQRRASRAPLAYLLGLALASLHAFPLGGCTAIFFNAGQAADERNPGPGLIPRESLVMLEPGSPVLLHLVDSTVVAGRYAGVGLGDSAGYRVAYEAWRSAQADSARWPLLGAPVTAHGKSDPPWIRGGGAFAGFTARGVAVEGRKADDPLAELSFGESGAIGIGSRLLYQYDVHRAVDAGLPVLTMIRVKTEPGGVLRTVPWREVDAVTVGKTRSHAVTGAIVGLAVDVLVVVVIVNAGQNTSGASGCETDPGWNPFGFASRAPGDFDTTTGRFVTDEPSQAFAADSSRGPAPDPRPAPGRALAAP